MFTSVTTKITYKIYHSFDCNNKSPIYLFNFNKQSTGKTTDHFRRSRTNYKSEARKAKSGNMENIKQKFFQCHFVQSDHQGFLKELEVRLIDKTLGSEPTKREFYWMRTLKTLYLDNLNIKSDYW